MPAQSEPAKSTINPVSSTSQNDIHNDEDKEEKTQELEGNMLGRLQDQIGRTVDAVRRSNGRKNRRDGRQV